MTAGGAATDRKGPDLLVIGAARAGTTALCRILARHPEVYLTKPKETHFLAFAGRDVEFTGPGDDRMINSVAVTDAEAWTALCDRGQSQRYRCDGSVSTLYYHEYSVPVIEQRYAEVPRMVVSLREPVERAFSSYLYLVSRGYEQAPTFAEALADESRRRDAGWHHLWHYEAMSHYGPQLRAFVDAFGADALFVFTHDEMRTDRAGLLARLCEWLDLDPRPTRVEQGEVNTGGVPKNPVLHRTIQRARASWVQPLVKAVTTERLRERVRRSNLEKPQLDPDVARRLAGRFVDDIAVVEDLLGRRLPAWRRVAD